MYIILSILFTYFIYLLFRNYIIFLSIYICSREWGIYICSREWGRRKVDLLKGGGRRSSMDLISIRQCPDRQAWDPFNTVIKKIFNLDGSFSALSNGPNQFLFSISFYRILQYKYKIILPPNRGGPTYIFSKSSRSFW